MIKTLAIETSCDDTSIWIVTYEDGYWANPILHTYSQITEHQEYGGVVPEIAYRVHEDKIIWLIERIGRDEVRSCDCISVTESPWLPGSLIVGNAAASTISAQYNIPLVRVNHIHGHLFSLLLDRADKDCPLPWLVLTVSGGHNEIYYILDKEEEQGGRIRRKDNNVTSETDIVGRYQISRIWYSLDDAAGESFDKVARMLWWDYPWGPWIDRMARQWWARDDIRFKRILLDDQWQGKQQTMDNHNLLNFSFSGMKSQMHQYLTKHPIDQLSQQDISDLCREFSECVSDILIQKIAWAIENYECATIWLVGWVSANDRLFDKLESRFADLNCLRPIRKVYSTDNAAMIWVVGIQQYLSATNK